jgi:CDP-4-dehydro-6-deoxyglucose reductase
MSHTVRIVHSGHQFIVNDDETVLEAALRQDIVLPYGCRNGACGSCMGTLLAGEVHYDDARIPALTADDQSQNRALFCQARPVTDLTIEVREIDTTGDIEVKTLPCRVAHLNAIAHDVMEIKLKLPAAERLQFLAGQYIEILLKDNRRRGFSIANAPHDDDFIVLHVRQVEGGYFSEFVFNQMQEKALLRL